MFAEQSSYYCSINFSKYYLGSDSLSTGAVATITFTLTFIITLTVTAIVTFIVAYYCVKKKKFGIELKPNNQPPQETGLYELVDPSNKTSTKEDFELQPNPAYGTSDKVIMDTNPAYESCM